jgi:hypothetical protein
MELLELERLNQPYERADMFAHVGEFLVASLYDFAVDIGELKVLETPPPRPPAKE